MGRRQRRKGSQYEGVVEKVLGASGIPLFQDFLATVQSDSWNCLLAGPESRARIH